MTPEQFYFLFHAIVDFCMKCFVLYATYSLIQRHRGQQSGHWQQTVGQIPHQIVAARRPQAHGPNRRRGGNAAGPSSGHRLAPTSRCHGAKTCIRHDMGEGGTLEYMGEVPIKRTNISKLNMRDPNLHVLLVDVWLVPTLSLLSSKHSHGAPHSSLVRFCRFVLLSGLAVGKEVRVGRKRHAALSGLGRSCSRNRLRSERCN